MNIETVRKSVLDKLEREKIPLLRFAEHCGIEQASLWRFLHKKTGLSGENILKLISCVDDDAAKTS